MPDDRLNHDELMEKSRNLLGSIVLQVSEFDNNINFVLRDLVEAKELYAINPLIDRLSFRSKIDALREIMEQKFSSNPELIAEIKEWHKKANSFRQKRNSFIHGRWGVVGKPSFKLINVAPGAIGPKPLKTTKFTIQEFENELRELKELQKSLREFRKKGYF